MTYTHLRVGTKPFRSKPPRKGPPCTEPYVRGSNILRDPGFELHLANVPSGTYDFPDISGTGAPASSVLYWDEVAAPRSLYYATGWSVSDRNSGSGEAVISTANPRSGTYHWRANYTSNFDLSFLNTNPIPVGGTYCALSAGQHLAYSARCAEGDYLRYGIWVSASNLSATPEVKFFWQFTTSTFSTIWSDNTTTTTIGATGYQWYEDSLFAPAGAWAVGVYAEVSTTSGTVPPVVIDMDDAVLEVR